jgi:hypothetical protein
MRRTTLFVSLLLLAAGAYAQKVAIKKVEVAGEKINVYYDLEDSNPANEYQIFLYSSHSSYATALTHVKGDVGNEVKIGANRRIEWNIREELGPYKGKLALEIRGKIYAPFVKLQNFDVAKTYKRGKSYPLQWKANSTNAIHIELYKGSERVTGELNHPNNGSYSLSVPASSKPGKDYRLKITDSRNSDEVIYTGYFKVAPKVPLLLKVVPVLAVGGLVAVLAGGSKGGPAGPGTTDNSPTEIELPAVPGN